MAKKISHHESERRYDPENLMGLDFHASRALGRKKTDGTPEFEGSYKAQRAAITKAEFRNTGVHKNEAEALRARMLELLDIRFQKRTPEQMELLKKLSDQVDAAVELEYPKKPKKGFPTKEAMKAKAREWFQSLSSKVLNGILKFCPHHAQFQVVSPDAVPVLLKNTPHKIWRKEGWENIAAGTWKFSVTDGREDLPFDDSIFYQDTEETDESRRIPRTNESMVAEYQRRYEAEGLTLMPQYGYGLAQRRALTEGRVLDRQYFSAFQRPTGAAWLPSAYWDFDRVSLDVDNPGNSLGALRARFWVEGEMSA